MFWKKQAPVHDRLLEAHLSKAKGADPFAVLFGALESVSNAPVAGFYRNNKNGAYTLEYVHHPADPAAANDDGDDGGASHALEPRRADGAELRQPRITGGNAAPQIVVPVARGDREPFGLLVWGPYRDVAAAKRALPALRDGAALLSALVEAYVDKLELQARVSRLEREIAIGRRTMASALSLERLAETLLAHGAFALRYEAAFFADVADAGTITLRWGYKVPPALASADLASTILTLDRFGDTVIVLSQDADVLTGYGIKHVLAVPIPLDGGGHCVIGLLSSGRVPPSDVHGLTMLEGIAHQLGQLSERETELFQFGSAYYDILASFCRTLDLTNSRDPHHHDRVAKLAVAVAQRMGVSDDDIRTLDRAARIHDVGRQMSDDSMMSIQSEFEHPTLGRAIVAPLPDGDALGRVIIEHHETYDGFGFPDNLAGQAITTLGAILAAAEHAAERSVAAIGAPDSPLALARELLNEAGRRLSPDVARACSHVVAEGGLDWPVAQEEGA